jgi:hypothetical protein
MLFLHTGSFAPVHVGMKVCLQMLHATILQLQKYSFVEGVHIILFWIPKRDTLSLQYVRNITKIQKVTSVERNTKLCGQKCFTKDENITQCTSNIMVCYSNKVLRYKKNLLWSRNCFTFVNIASFILLRI